MPFSTSLYVVEHTQLQMKVEARLHDRKINIQMAGLAGHPMDSLPRGASLRDSYTSYPEHGSLPLTAGL